ncbi:hypothetical protein BASA81_010605 [Batrachochytrium salamandrivorans]|nr:hypothetical protein BASA81_010605 [Batrachochytrium salamandrivorans]
MNRGMVPMALLLVAMVYWAWTFSSPLASLSSFLEYCSLGHISTINQLLASHPELLEAADGEGMTCLINAGKHGRVGLVKELISNHHVQLNQPEAIHHALRGAAIYGQYEVCDLLLQAGAQVDALSRGGLTALMGAMRSGHLNIAQLLLRHGADCRIQNHFSETAKDLNPQLVIDC